ncbi:MAG: hypothetical protein ACK5WZ_07245 [Pseudobdellovibrionaceae bacterium]
MSYKKKSFAQIFYNFSFPTLFSIICLMAALFSVRSVSAQSVSYGPPIPVPALVVKSYTQWKSEKIQFLSFKIQEIQQKQRTEPGSMKPKEIAVLKEAEVSEMENLRMAKKLRISDYLITYIFGFSNRKAALREAATLMSSTEIAEVMEAYAHSFSKKEVGSVPLSADLIGSDIDQ